jgi:hypothetical protein
MKVLITGKVVKVFAERCKFSERGNIAFRQIADNATGIQNLI